MSFECSYLDAVAEIIDSLHKTPVYSDVGQPMVRVTDVKYGVLNLDSTFKVDSEIFDEFSRRYKPKRNDIVITRVGSFGITALVKDTNFCLGQNTAAIVPKSINPKYLYAALNSPFLREQIEASAVGSTQKTLSLKCIKLLRIPRLGPQSEDAVAELIGSLDDRIALLRETNATLEAIAQALFKSWFVDFDPVHANAGTQAPSLPPEIQALFPATFTDSPQGLIPEGWSWKTLDEAYEINPKRLLKKGALAKYLDMASVQTQGHVTEDVIERAFGSGTKFCNGDTLLARITPCLENGKTAFVDFLEPNETGWGSTEFVILKPKAPLPDFHGYLLARQSVFREFAIRSMSGTSGRQRVQNDVLGSFYLAIPDEPIAAAFAQIVTPIQQSISANHKQAKTLAALRDTLLPRLISGKLRLPDAQVTLEEDIYAAK